MTCLLCEKPAMSDDVFCRECREEVNRGYAPEKEERRRKWDI